MPQLRTFRKDADSERNLETIRAALQERFGASFATYSDAIRNALHCRANAAEIAALLA